MNLNTSIVSLPNTSRQERSSEARPALGGLTTAQSLSFTPNLWRPLASCSPASKDAAGLSFSPQSAACHVARGGLLDAAGAPNGARKCEDGKGYYRRTCLRVVTGGGSTGSIAQQHGKSARHTVEVKAALDARSALTAVGLASRILFCLSPSPSMGEFTNRA